MDRTCRRNRLALCAVALLVVSAGSGCAHHCGYINVRATFEDVPARHRSLVRPTRVLLMNVPGPENPEVVVKVAALVTEQDAVVRALSGQKTYTDYDWTVPFLKLLLPVSLPLAVVEPWRQPHCHDAGPWGWGDYGRDFVGWLNPFEAYPGATEQMSGERVTIRQDLIYKAEQVRLLAVQRGRMILYLGNQKLAEQYTAANGYCTFDLRPLMGRLQLGGRLDLDVVYQEDRLHTRSRTVSIDEKTTAAWRRAYQR